MPTIAQCHPYLQMRNLSGARFQAVLFDIDGTLYDQRRLRAAMLVKLSRYAVSHPRAGWQAVRILRAYRKAQEWMRFQSQEFGDLAETQLKLAAEWSHADVACVRRCIRLWMEEQPAALMLRCRMPMLAEFLGGLKVRGIKTAVCSDYPAAGKLRALGIHDWIDCAYSAQDAGIQRLKPHPRMLEAALDGLGVSPRDAVYLGDRPGVDGVAASRAGMTFISVSPRLGFQPLLETFTHD